jgi:hypothetical protein
MGKTKGSYKADYAVGSYVRVASRDILMEFMRPKWRFHNPLQPEQLEYAERVARVKDVGYYHGGDELYELVDIPGIWHEKSLSACDGSPRE